MMKNTVKRTLSALLAAASLTAALSGCGSTPAAEGDAALADTGADTTSAESEYGPVLTRIAETGKMVVATASGYMPYEFIDITSSDQKVIGVDMALGERIAEKLSETLGVDVETQIENTTFTANLAAIAADQVDIMIAGMSPTDERRENMDFSDIYLKAEQRLMVRAEDAAQYTDLAAFAGKTIAVQINTTQATIAHEVLTDSNVTDLERIPNAMLELTTGNADAVVIESTVAQPYLLANPDLVLCDAALPEERLYKDTAIAVPKGNEDFLALVNETIKECQDEGLIDQWIAEYSAICAEQNAA